MLLLPEMEREDDDRREDGFTDMEEVVAPRVSEAEVMPVNREVVPVVEDMEDATLPVAVVEDVEEDCPTEEEENDGEFDMIMYESV